MYVNLTLFEHPAIFNELSAYCVLTLCFTDGKGVIGRLSGRDGESQPLLFSGLFIMGNKLIFSTQLTIYENYIFIRPFVKIKFNSC